MVQQGAQKEMKSIRVTLVDDDPFVRTSLSTILGASGDIEICGEAGDGREAIVLYEETQPDVLLMDIQMPNMTGIEAAEAILAAHPQARIVFLTTFSDDEYIASALKLGSKGYLIKQEVANIAPALHSVMAGQVVLGTEVLDHMDSLMSGARDLQGGGGSGTFESDLLSRRERQIVELVAQGLDNKEIAQQVYISEGTVRNHVSAILQKLDLKNRTQLASFYYRNFS